MLKKTNKNNDLNSVCSKVCSKWGRFQFLHGPLRKFIHFSHIVLGIQTTLGSLDINHRTKDLMIKVHARGE